jgi:S-adenosylmethionine:tRNA ribosyltransferase-isomerase
MKTSDFDYCLPDAAIAYQPPTERGGSKLLVLDRKTGQLTDKLYPDMVDYVMPGDVVVLNDTKVIPARLMTTKQSNGAVREILLLEQHGSSDNWHRHNVLYKRHLNVNEVLLAADGTALHVSAIVGDGVAEITSPVNLMRLAERLGSVPLPPYLHRDASNADTRRYQTVWASHPGSVAAPTASLNMTQETIQRLIDKGARVVYLTLHVGLGTFLPIRSDDLSEHDMHREYFEIDVSVVQAVQEAKQTNHKVFAVGTTVTRTLEYASDMILNHTAQDISGEADIFIYSGYAFKTIDALLTNFHAPRSTVLMMVAAFASWPYVQSAYTHALANGYRFLSYGDSMLIM